jgi:hypothetical protein
VQDYETDLYCLGVQDYESLWVHDYETDLYWLEVYDYETHHSGTNEIF